MNPICTDCNVEMRCEKTGVTVAHINSPSWVRNGDKYVCPNCRNTIISSLGEAYDSNVEAMVIIEDAMASAKVNVIQETIDWMNEL
jgi:hypothetical protein